MYLYKIYFYKIIKNFVGSILLSCYLRRAYIFVAVIFEYLRMRNFSVFSICSHCFKKSSIILLEYNTFYIPLGTVKWK